MSATTARAEYDALVWQAQAQIDIGVMIERYLTEHPPPVLAADALLYRSWAADLRRAGEAHLATMMEAEIASESLDAQAEADT